MFVDTCIIEKKDIVYLKVWLPKKAIYFRNTSIKSFRHTTYSKISL